MPRSVFAACMCWPLTLDGLLPSRPEDDDFLSSIPAATASPLVRFLFILAVLGLVILWAFYNVGLWFTSWIETVSP